MLENGVSEGTSRASLPYLGAHYIITVLQYVYTRLILQLYGRSGTTGTHGNYVLTANNLGSQGTGTRAQQQEEQEGRCAALAHTRSQVGIVTRRISL